MNKKIKKISLKSKSLNHKLLGILIMFVFLNVLIVGVFGLLIGDKILERKLKNLSGSQLESISETETGGLSGSEYSLKQEDQAVIEVVKNNTPAVVSIVITKDIPKIDSFFSDPFFNQFYFGGDVETETETQEIGGGTGFIVDPSGYILTNKHVVDDPDAKYTIMLNNGETFDAEILARDVFLDVAVLKINGKNLPTINFGDSEKLNVGQTVIAIGNSLGEFDNTVSKGIISGLKRQVEAGNSLGQTEILDEVIQTDAAINPGNSGGPLFDLNGKVIGINVAMAQGAENIGFTIPINQIKELYQSVKDTGKIVRPQLGVRYLIINEKIQKMNNLAVDYGALILRGNSRNELAIIPGSPADKAGLMEYDIILEINGEKITEKNGLAKLINKRKIGEEITLKVLSKGEEKTVKTVLKEVSL